MPAFYLLGDLSAATYPALSCNQPVARLTDKEKAVEAMLAEPADLTDTDSEEEEEQARTGRRTFTSRSELHRLGIC